MGIMIPTIALSVRQPWAWAIVHGNKDIVHGVKDIENRSAAAVRHGMRPAEIAIHAARGMTRDEYENARRFMQSIGVDCPRPDLLTRGAVIGRATVTAIVRRHESPWFVGPCGLVLANAAAAEMPIPAQGELGYFHWRPSGGPPAPVLRWMETWGIGSSQIPLLTPPADRA